MNSLKPYRKSAGSNLNKLIVLLWAAGQDNVIIMYQRYILFSNELFIQSKHSARSVPPPYSNLIMIHVQRYILCSNGRESEEGGTKPSIKPLTTDRFKKPSSFSFVRVLSALYRKKPVP